MHADLNNLKTVIEKMKNESKILKIDAMNWSIGMKELALAAKLEANAGI